MRKELPVQSGWYPRSSGEISCELERLHERIEALETGRSGPAQLIPKHEQRLDGLELTQRMFAEIQNRVIALETYYSGHCRVEVYDPGEAVPERRHGITVTIRSLDHEQTLDQLTQSLRRLCPALILVDACGPTHGVLVHLRHCGLPAEALPKGLRQPR